MNIKALIIIFIMAVPALVSAANHALIMGVGTYRHLPQRNQLEGPAFDLTAMEKMLVENYGFSRENITVLADKKATKASILKHLNQLEQKTGAGDFILIYFSGHGTSGFDPSSSELGIDPYTGALLPEDFELGSSRTMHQKAIIGRRDLHPIFSRLEKDRNVLVFFDCCYSGDTVRSVKRFGKPRYVPLPLVHSKTRDLVLDEEGAKAPPYPYKNLVYISASSRREQAWDIDSSLIKLGFKTYDDRPHGAMTDALLKGMSGRADSNTDGRVSYNELYQFVRNTVSAYAPQTPQLLFNPEQTAFLNRSFGQSARSPLPEKPLPGKNAQPVRLSDAALKIKLEGLSADLEKDLSEIEGVEIVDHGQNLSVTRAESEYRLFAANGNVLVAYPLDQPSNVVERVANYRAARGLIDYKPARQSFNLFMNMLGAKGVLAEGESFDFSLKTERDAYLLLFDVDPLGNINIIYPTYREELEMVKTGSDITVSDITVVEPFGIDHLKALAFEQEPKGLENLMGQSFAPGQREFQTLVGLVNQYGPTAAEATLQVKTCSKDDLVWLGQ